MDRITSLVVDSIDYAINKELAAKTYVDFTSDSGQEYWSAVGNKEVYSCTAVLEAVEHTMNREYPNTDWGHRGWCSRSQIKPSRELLDKRFKEERKVQQRFSSLARKAGCPVDSTNAFDKLPPKKRQQARALWLTNLRHAIVEGLI